MRRATDSGEAATRFSKGKVSLGIPTVNLAYGLPLGGSFFSTFSQATNVERYERTVLLVLGLDDEVRRKRRNSVGRSETGPPTTRNMMISCRLK